MSVNVGDSADSIASVLDKLPNAKSSDAQKAKELLLLFTFIKTSAETLCVTSNFIGKAKLKEELKIHAHLFQKTLNTIEAYAKK